MLLMLLVLLLVFLLEFEFGLVVKLIFFIG